MDTKRETNSRSFAAPNKYVQGAGVFDELPRMVDIYGGRPAIILDAQLEQLLADRILNLFNDDSQLSLIMHEGEITEHAIEEVVTKLRDCGCGVVVGVGGGKTIDVAKVASHRVGLESIIVPTSASSDAPCSSLGVVYKESGEHSHEVFLPRNPTLVLVDTQIIASAPPRLLVAGMGDALATYFEAEANARNYSVNVVSEELGLHLGGGLAARAMGRLCYDTLMRDGRDARLAAELGVVTPALENVVEANTLLSGIGFESNGTAAAHAINDGLSVIPAGARMLHGERVAFGVLCELVLENASLETRTSVRAFCVDVGLPISLADLGLGDISTHELEKVVDAAYDNVIHAEPMVITRELIWSSILVANAESLEFQRHRAGACVDKTQTSE